MCEEIIGRSRARLPFRVPALFSPFQGVEAAGLIAMGRSRSSKALSPVFFPLSS
jgi:hypothetical protein